MLNFSENNPLIAVLGDVHGIDWIVTESIRKTVDYCNDNNIQQPEVLVQVGDFWSYSHKQLKTISYTAKKNNMNIVFIPGNHEDWDKLDEWSTSDITMIKDNVYYAPIGSSALIYNKKVLFVGGAVSPDKNNRTPGYDWYPQESISMKQYDTIMNTIDNNIDIIISHDSPLDVSTPVHFIVTNDKINKECLYNRELLKNITDKTQAELLIHGHYHNYYELMVDNNDYQKKVIGVNKEKKPGSLLLINTTNNNSSIIR